MKEIAADLTTTELVHIAHGCNAQGKMGSGVAKAVRAKWPKAYTEYVKYLEHRKASAFNPLGTDLWVEINDGKDNIKIIHNLITQEFYGRDGSKFARYRYVYNALVDMIVQRSGAKQFAVSRLGCSLGGLKWEFVKELMLEVEEEFGVEFWVYHIEVDPDA